MHDIAVRPVLLAASAIALTVGAIAGGVIGLLHWARIPAGGAPVPPAQVVQLQAPGLWSAPQDALRRERQGERARLDSAGWVDRGQGIAHIPIGDAIDLLVAGRSKQDAR